MSGSTARLDAIKAINAGYKVESMNFAKTPVTELYGSNVFTDEVMKDRIPKAAYKSFQKTLEDSGKLDESVADCIATAMKDWAIDKGATHFAHVFYPLTGSTAEKHDAFVAPDGVGKCVTEFNGRTLIQGEPDGSSFPNGGIRDTFEARGYTAWDITSPTYVLECDNGTTLCIPTIFVSWTGEALDKKTPVLRSMDALDKAAQRVLKLLGNTHVRKVSSSAGPEQEYFLVDNNFYYARPDLVSSDRTLFGASPAKGQEFDDHYFGAIPDRVLACMMEVERELYKLAIPVKTRHNEVAPGQYEIAPVFESANLATDHQMLMMYMVKRVAKKHGMTAIFHEKPFAGLNGSGKHLNWSLGNSSQGNLLDPGKDPHKNTQFLLFCAAVISAVDKHAGLLRGAIASASNDHRLGANEAPPAIISVYLGDQLNDIFEQIRKTGSAATSKKGGVMDFGMSAVPDLLKDAGDRNRTSPFAFTGNRFEFRAVGASQSIAGPIVALNTILAEALGEIGDTLESKINGGGDAEKASMEIIKELVDKHWRVVFNGNGYEDAWQDEAAKRGLKNLKTTPEALKELITPEVKETFKKLNVLSEVELDSRFNIYNEQYVMKINVEANLTEKVAQLSILPAAIRYQTELAENAMSLKAAGVEGDNTTLKNVTGLINSLVTAIDALKKARDKHFEDLAEEASYFAATVIPAMNDVRDVVDALEGIVADDLWPLPNYTEMLFIK
ncbi:MAG: glutamine synthetase III [Nitrospinae bacterium]|nr:glutamine synthetase III [Nitrospinota bacterium]